LERRGAREGALLRLAALEIFPQRRREAFAAAALFVRTLAHGIHGVEPIGVSWKGLDRRAK